jgi:hypothetical protein
VTAAHPHLRAVSPETELDSRALRREGSALPKVLVLYPLAVRTAALESALPQAGWAAPLAIVWRRAAAREMARPSAGLAARARRLAGPVVSAAQAAVLPPEEPAGWDAAVVPQQVAVAWDAAVAPQQEVAAWDVAEAPRQAVAWVGAAALPPEAVRQLEARDAAAVPLRGAVLRAVPDVRVAEPRAARPSAVPWVFRRDQALPWPAPQPVVRFARAMQGLQIALP